MTDFTGEDGHAALATGLAADLKAIGFKNFDADLKTLIGVITTKGQPIDDRQHAASQAFPKLCAEPS